VLVRNAPTGLAICETPTDGLHDVEVVQDVIEAAIVRQTVEERPNGIFGGHVNLREDAPSIRPAPRSAKFEINSIQRFDQQSYQRSRSPADAHKRRGRLVQRVLGCRSAWSGGIMLPLMHSATAEVSLGGVDVGAIAVWIDERVRRVLRGGAGDELTVPPPPSCVAGDPDVDRETPQNAEAAFQVRGLLRVLREFEYAKVTGTHDVQKAFAVSNGE